MQTVGAVLSGVPVEQYVYIVHAVGTSTYKIGISKNPTKRVRDMQTSCPLPLQLISKIRCKDAHAAEESLHALLGKYHVRGEWFTLDDQAYDMITAEIEKHLAGEQSEFDSQQSAYFLRAKRKDHHQRKGNVWVHYTCTVCGEEKVTGDESQSAKSHVCYECWRQADKKTKIEKRKMQRELQK